MGTNKLSSLIIDKDNLFVLTSTTFAKPLTTTQTYFYPSAIPSDVMSSLILSMQQSLGLSIFWVLQILQVVLLYVNLEST